MISFAELIQKDGLHYNSKRRLVDRALAMRDGSACFYCGAAYSPDFHRDHVVSQANGGSHSIDNLVLACRQCNRVKGTKPAWFFVLLLHADRRGPLTVTPELRCPTCDDARLEWKRDSERELWLVCQLCEHRVVRGVRYQPKKAK